MAKAAQHVTSRSETNPVVAELVEEYARVHALKADIEQQMKDIIIRLKEHQDDHKVFESSQHRMTQVAFTRTDLDAKALRAAHPKIAKRFEHSTPVAYYALRVR